MARISKSQQAILDEYGFVVETPPEKDHTRVSRYDAMWEAARSFLTANPGVTIKVRTYSNASAAYSEAKRINNSEHRMFKDGSSWLAVGSKDGHEVDEEGNPVYALWLTYIDNSEPTE